MRALGLAAILLFASLLLPGTYGAVFHDSAQIRGGVLGSDFGSQNFTVNGTLDLDTLRFIGESISITSISSLSTLGGVSASNASLPTQWAVKAYIDNQVSGTTDGSGVAGRIPFFYDSDTLTSSASFVYDSGTGRVGIGTDYPTEGLEVSGRNVLVSIGLGDGWDLNDASYDSVSLDVETESTRPGSFAFRSDGLRLYVLDSNTQAVYEYTLSTPWSLSSALYSRSGSVSETSWPDGVAFSSDGTKLFVLDSELSAGTQTIYAYDLSDAWNISSLSYSGENRSVAAQASNPRDLLIRSNGVDLFVLDAGSDVIFQYELSDPWNVSSATYTGTSHDVTSEDADPQGFAFRSDGTRLYVYGDGGSIYQYSVSTAWNLTAVSYDSVSYSTVSQSGDAKAIAFRSDGTKLYAAKYGTSGPYRIYQYSVAGSLTGGGLVVEGNAAFGTGTANNRLTVQGSADISGNLGIGNTSPTNRLSVAGDADIDRLAINTSSPSAALEVQGGFLFTGQSIVIDTFSGDAILGGGSSANTTVPTQWAVKSYVDAQFGGSGSMSNFTVSGDSGSSVIVQGDTLAVAGGTGVTTGVVGDTVTVSVTNDSIDGAQLADAITLDAPLIINTDEVRVGAGTPGVATGAGDLFVTDALEVDGSIVLGANTITGFSTATALGTSDALLPTQNAVKAYVDAQFGGSGSMSNFTLAGDSGSSVIVQGDTLDVAGGASITTSAATDTVTVDVTDDSIDGTELADTITLDAVLAVNGQDVNFDANTLFVDVSANRVGVGEAVPGASLDVNGNLILQSGVAVNEFSIDDTLAGNSDLAVPTEQAVKAYVDTAVTGLGTFSNFTLTGDSGTAQLISQGNTVDIAGGTGISTVVGATDTVTVSITADSIDGAQLADTITLDAPLIINTDEVRVGAGTPGVALGAGDLFVTDALEVDGSIVLGANTITGFSTATALGTSDALLPTQNAVKSYVDSATSGLGSGSMSNFTLAGDSGSSLIVQGDTLDVAGGASITTSAATDTVTVDVTDDSIDGTELADTITLDAVLAINGQDVNFDANTLFVDVSANRVGVGDNTPDANLDVQGVSDAEGSVLIDDYEIKILNSGQAHWSIFNNETTGDFYIADTSASASPGTLGTNRFVIDRVTGAIGIGTNDPVGRLQVVGDEVRIGSGTPGVATGDGDLFVTDALEVDGSIVLGANTITGFSTATALGTSDALLPTQNAVKVYVDNAVSGFGSGSMSNFTLAGDSGSSLIVQGDTLDVAGGTSITTSAAGDTVTVAVTADSIDGAQLADTITLDANLAVTQGSLDVNFDSNTLFIDGSANRVGVGTASPDFGLHVVGGSYVGTNTGASPFIIARSGAGRDVLNEEEVRFSVDDQNYIQEYIQDESTAQFILRLNATASESGTPSYAVLTVSSQGLFNWDDQLHVSTVGDVGIGAASSGAKLDVDGDLILQNGVAINEFSIDDTLAGNSDLAVPTEQAVKAYVDAQFGSSGSMSNFTLAGDSGSSLIVQGDTLDVAGGTGITTSAAGDTVTVAVTADSIDGTELADTITLDAVLAVNGQDVNFDANTLFVDVSANRVGVGEAVPGASLDVNGNLILQSGVAINEFSIDDTLVGNSDLAVPTEQAVKAYVDNAVSGLGTGSMNGFTLVGDSGTSPINDSDTLDVAGGTGITTSVSGDTVTVAVTADSIDGAQLADTITLDAPLVINTDEVRVGAGTPGVALGAGDLFVTDALEVDGSIVLGANTITGFSTSTSLGTSNALLPTQNAVKSYVDSSVSGFGTFSNFTLTGDSGTSQLISQGNTLDIAGGASISTVVGATDTVTVDVTDDSINGAELADTITLDAVLAVNGQDVNFDAGTLFVDVSANRVGVGTASPGQTLDVGGNARIDGDLIVISTTAGAYPTQLSVDDNTDFNTRLEGSMAGGNDYFRIRGNGTSDAGQLLIYTGDNGNEPIIFAQQSGTTFNERLRIDSSGRLAFPAGTAINEFSIDDTLAGNSDLAVPTEQAVKAYVDTATAGFGTLSNFTLAGDSGSSLISQGDTVDVAGGTGITTSAAADTVTVSITADSIDGAQLADTITLDAPLVINTDEVRVGAGTPGVALGAGDLFVTDALEVDGSIVLGANTITGFSTVTSLGTSNALLPTQNAVKSYVDNAISGFGTMSGFTLAGDSGTSPINDSDTLDVAGGTAITTSVSGDTVTVGVTADSIGGTELADTITLDANLAITQNTLDVNFDANTLFIDGSANRVGIGTSGPGSALHVNGDEIRAGTGTPGFATGAGDIYATDDIEIDDDLYIAGTINQSATGVVQGFSNGCTMIANATGLYWNC